MYSAEVLKACLPQSLADSGSGSRLFPLQQKSLGNPPLLFLSLCEKLSTECWGLAILFTCLLQMETELQGKLTVLIHLAMLLQGCQFDALHLAVLFPHLWEQTHGTLSF